MLEEVKVAGSVLSAEEETKSAPNSSLPLLSGWQWRKCMEKANMLLNVNNERSKSNTHKLQKGKL